MGRTPVVLCSAPMGNVVVESPNSLTLLDRVVSGDGTVKLRFAPGSESYRFEACLLSLPYRTIPIVLCVSTQVGCPFDCRFCAVGAGQYVRNLTTEEIRAQVELARKDQWWAEKRGLPYEIAAMGTGEPLLALQNLTSAVRESKSVDPNIISLNVATVGIPDRVIEYSNIQIAGVQTHLQLSLHAATDEQRSMLMPKAVRYRISEILSACRVFAQKRGVKVVVNYLLISDVNDSLEDAATLARILDPAHFSIKISQLNSTSSNVFLVGASLGKMQAFCEILRSKGHEARVFSSAGGDVGAGCGQFGNKAI